MKKLRPRWFRIIMFVLTLFVIGFMITKIPNHEAPTEVKVYAEKETQEKSSIPNQPENKKPVKSVAKQLEPKVAKTAAVEEESISSESWTNWTSYSENYYPVTVQEAYTRIANSGNGAISNYEKEMLAQLLYGEANSVQSEAERAMVVWSVLNRYDSGSFGNSISEIVSAPMQFTGYDSSNPVTDANLSLVEDVVDRWERENAGEEDVGRTLPEEYCYFVADSDPSIGEWHNAFYAYEYGNDGDKIWYDYENPEENPY